MRGKRFIWRFSFALAILGLILPLGMVGRAEAVAREAPHASQPVEDEQLAPAPYTYARVLGRAAVYRSPEDAASGRGPIRSVGGGYVWVSLNQDPLYVEHNGETWVQINPGEYVRAKSISIYQPSAFQGVVVLEQPTQPFGWILKPVQPSPAPGQAPDPHAPTLARYTLVTVQDAKYVGGVLWDQIGPDQWIKHVMIGQVSVSPRPERIGPADKWIEVNLYEQTLAAYEGDRMVYATLVSSGLPQWSTPRGLTRVWWKLRAAKMSGAQGRADYYFLEDVPWIMYFNGAVALHGAYWHDGFGYVHSHGCVNLAPRDAQWLFNWTTPSVPDDQNAVKPTEEDPGTWVWVH